AKDKSGAANEDSKAVVLERRSSQVSVGIEKIQGVAGRVVLNCSVLDMHQRGAKRGNPAVWVVVNVTGADGHLGVGENAYPKSERRGSVAANLQVLEGDVLGLADIKRVGILEAYDRGPTGCRGSDEDGPRVEERYALLAGSGHKDNEVGLAQ